MNVCYFPTSFAYLEGKLMRETLNVFKSAWLNYPAALTQFYRGDNMKIAGLSFPNLLSYVVKGGTLDSGYTMRENLETLISSGRFSDAKLVAPNRFNYFYNFPLFVDNYGSEITLQVVLIVLTIFCWLAAILVHYEKLEEGSSWKKFWTAVEKGFKWNFMMATIIGASQSIFYYTLISVRGLTSLPKASLNDAVDVCIGGLLSFLTIIILPSGIIGLINEIQEYQKAADRDINLFIPLEERLPWFTNLYLNFKLQKGIYGKFTTFLILRALLFSAILAYLDNVSPVLPPLGMFLIAGLICAFSVWKRPFSDTYLNIVHWIYEGILLMYLLFMTILGWLDTQNNFSSSARSFIQVMLIFLWMALSFFNVGVTGFELFYWRKKAPLKKLLIPESVEESEKVEVNILHGIGDDRPPTPDSEKPLAKAIDTTQPLQETKLNENMKAVDGTTMDALTSPTSQNLILLDSQSREMQVTRRPLALPNRQMPRRQEDDEEDDEEEEEDNGPEEDDFDDGDLDSLEDDDDSDDNNEDNVDNKNSNGITNAKANPTDAKKPPLIKNIDPVNRPLKPFKIAPLSFNQGATPPSSVTRAAHSVGTFNGGGFFRSNNSIDKNKIDWKPVTKNVIDEAGFNKFLRQFEDY